MRAKRGLSRTIRHFIAVTAISLVALLVLLLILGLMFFPDLLFRPTLVMRDPSLALLLIAFGLLEIVFHYLLGRRG